jgi:hypothetical protein
MYKLHVIKRVCRLSACMYAELEPMRDECTGARDKKGCNGVECNGEVEQQE